jgi:hypothetical protein
MNTRPSAVHAVVFFAMSVLPCAGVLHAQTVRYSVHATLDRLLKYDTLGTEHEVRIRAARNEYEGAHIVLRAEGRDIIDADLRLTPLISPRGDTIGVDHISLYREHYLRIDTLSYRSTGRKGWYPDALVPFSNPYDGGELAGARFDARPYTIASGENQAYYLEAHVPEHAVAGDYSGEVVVSSANAAAVSIPVSLHVWDFALPDSTPVRSNFGVGGGRFNEIFQSGTPRWEEARRRFDRELYRHRLCPPYPYGTLCSADSTGRIDSSKAHATGMLAYDTLHANSAMIPMWTNWPYPRLLTSQRDKAVNYLRTYSSYYRRHGWQGRLYTYLVDEPNDRPIFSVSCSLPGARLTITDTTLVTTTAASSPDAVFDFRVPAYATIHAVRDSLAARAGYAVSALQYAIPEGVHSRGSFIRVANLDIGNASSPGMLHFTEYEEVRQLAALVREADPEIQLLCTEQTRSSDPAWGNLNGAVDIWCPLFGYYDSVTAMERQAAGDEMWIYTALCQPGPRHLDSPYWETDYPLLNYRVPLWIMWRWGIKGLLYWEAAYWDQSRDPWTNPISYGIGSSIRYNGEGSLFYPGPDAGFDGPVVSLRLKAIRDGIEDFMYLEKAWKLGLTDVIGRAFDAVAQGWSSWNPDTRVMDAARDSIAVAIERHLTTGMARNDRAVALSGCRLFPPYPNPCTDRATISFLLERPSVVVLKIQSLLGRECAVPADGVFDAGMHSISLSTLALPDGVYLATLIAGRSAQTAIFVVGNARPGFTPHAGF